MGFTPAALFSHPDQPDGIAYASRHGPDQVCVALFSRPDIALEVLSGPTPLTDMAANVSDLLRRYAATTRAWTEGGMQPF